MTDQSNVLNLGIVLIDLNYKLVGIACRDQVLGRDNFFFSQIELLRQDFRRLSRSKVRAGQDQVYLHSQFL